MISVSTVARAMKLNLTVDRDAAVCLPTSDLLLALRYRRHALRSHQRNFREWTISYPCESTDAITSHCALRCTTAIQSNHVLPPIAIDVPKHHGLDPFKGHLIFTVNAVALDVPLEIRAICPTDGVSINGRGEQ